MLVLVVQLLCRLGVYVRSRRLPIHTYVPYRAVRTYPRTNTNVNTTDSE